MHTLQFHTLPCLQVRQLAALMQTSSTVEGGLDSRVAFAAAAALSAYLRHSYLGTRCAILLPKHLCPPTFAIPTWAPGAILSLENPCVWCHCILFDLGTRCAILQLKHCCVML